MREEFAVTVNWREGFQFDVDFEQDGVGDLRTDEPPPLGEGRGPNPAQLLAAAVGNCMAASLKFCLDRARIEVHGLTTRVEGTIERNEDGRLRIGGLRVHLDPAVQEGDVERVERCLGVFEDFCIVGQSVRSGIDVRVDVTPRPSPGPAATVG
jgi:organic hydroperoxide reductase OsmC/OhrA